MSISFHITSDLSLVLQELKTKKLPLKPLKTKQWLNSVAADYQFNIGILNIIFCTDQELLKINKEYLLHDYYTDIITFDYSSKTTIEGELYISVQTVTANAIEYNTSPYNELYRVMVHGILHLCGENDLSEKEKEEMKKAEDAALLRLNEYNIFI